MDTIEPQLPGKEFKSLRELWEENPRPRELRYFHDIIRNKDKIYLLEFYDSEKEVFIIRLIKIRRLALRVTIAFGWLKNNGRD